MIKKIKRSTKPKAEDAKEVLKFKKRFYELMFELNLYNKFKKTYFLDIKKKTNYGYYAHLYLSTGLSYGGLDDNRITIEENLQCMWIMKTKSFREYAEVQIVLKPVDESMQFKNPKIKPHEMYLGLSFANKMQVNDSNDNCMYLLAGATGSGKTRFMYQVLLSWIMSCTPDQVWIYLADVAKNEYIQFQDVDHVKCYASDLDELYKMMTQVKKELNRRSKLLTEYRKRGIATNILEYNKIKEIKKLPYCYIVIDELSIVQLSQSDSKDTKDQKGYILAILEEFAKLGRSLGMFTFVATQKTTKSEMPIIIKNMSSVRISFSANDEISSRVVMEGNSAVGLPPRVAVYSLDGGTNINYLYSPSLITEDGKLQQMLKPYIKSVGNVNIYDGRHQSEPSGEVKNFKITRVPKRHPDMPYDEYLKILGLGKSSNKEEEYNDY